MGNMICGQYQNNHGDDDYLVDIYDHRPTGEAKESRICWLSWWLWTGRRLGGGRRYFGIIVFVCFHLSLISAHLYVYIEWRSLIALSCLFVHHVYLAKAPFRPFVCSFYHHHHHEQHVYNVHSSSRFLSSQPWLWYFQSLNSTQFKFDWGVDWCWRPPGGSTTNWIQRWLKSFARLKAF